MFITATAFSASAFLGLLIFLLVDELVHKTLNNLRLVLVFIVKIWHQLIIIGNVILNDARAVIVNIQAIVVIKIDVIIVIDINNIVRRFLSFISIFNLIIIGCGSTFARIYFGYWSAFPAFDNIFRIKFSTTTGTDNRVRLKS